MMNLQRTNFEEGTQEIIDRIEKIKQEEINQLENRYHNILAEKDGQHREFLEEIDQLMLE